MFRFTLRYPTLALALLGFALGAHGQSTDSLNAAKRWQPFVVKSDAAIVNLNTTGFTRARATDELAKVRAAQAAAAKDEAEQERIRYWNAGAPSYRWNQIALDTAKAGSGSGPQLTERVMAITNMAIYDALLSAARLKNSMPTPQSRSNANTFVLPAVAPTRLPVSEHAVVAGAAASILGDIYPDQAQALQKRAQEAAWTRVSAGADFPASIELGLEIGRRAGLQVAEAARKDGSDKEWKGSVPTTLNRWNGKAPSLPQLAEYKPWILSSPNQVRPPAPPEFTEKDMDEVRRTITSSEKVAAYRWAITSLPRYWNEHLSRKLFERREDDALTAARKYAYFTIAYYDTIIANWDAKFAYWGQRPFQYDTNFKSMITTPNFPGYPSGHAQLCGSAATILGAFFPEEKETFWKLAEESANSRLWAGVHFSIDNTIGLLVGKQIGEIAVKRYEAE
jgi:hypothetical protein